MATDLSKVMLMALAMGSIRGYEREGPHGLEDVRGYNREWFHAAEAGSLVPGSAGHATGVHNFMHEELHAEEMHHVSGDWLRRKLGGSGLQPSASHLNALRAGSHDYPLVDHTSHYGAVADLGHLGHDTELADAAVRQARGSSVGGPATFQDARRIAEAMTAARQKAGSRIRHAAGAMRQRLAGHAPQPVPVRVRT